LFQQLPRPFLEKNKNPLFWEKEEKPSKVVGFRGRKGGHRSESTLSIRNKASPADRNSLSPIAWSWEKMEEGQPARNFSWPLTK